MQVLTTYIYYVLWLFPGFLTSTGAVRRNVNSGGGRESRPDGIRTRDFRIRSPDTGLPLAFSNNNNNNNNMNNKIGFYFNF